MRNALPYKSLPVLLCSLLLALGCNSLERNHPLDPSAAVAGDEGAALTLSVPLPKPLATVVDSLVARLDVPNAPTIIKELTYETPLGPALLTIGALSPGSGVTLTIEGYDLDGRLILTGTQTNITIAADDTTRVSIDLRLAIALEDLQPDDGGDTGDGGADTGTDTGTDAG